MRAAVFDAASGVLELQSVPDPAPGPGEVVVQVAACGVCLSDVHLLDGSMPAPLSRVVPGHEAAGTVVAVGAQVPVWAVGDAVVLSGGGACGSCPSCAAGRSDDCSDIRVMGFSYDGGWADMVKVPFGYLTRAPWSVPLTQAAILADAVATPWAALTTTAELRPAEAVGLWGIGGLGVHAVQLARLAGAHPVIAVDPLPAARQRALDAGADAALDPADDVPTIVRELTGGRGLDVALDFAGNPRAVAQSTASLARLGRVVLVGLFPDDLNLGPAVLFGLYGHQVRGHLGYAKPHLEQLVRLVDGGRLDLSASVSSVLPLDRVHDGVALLTDKQTNPVRVVLAPSGGPTASAR